MATDGANGKTVYILGAGFSKPAGGLSQDQIMKEVISLPDHDKVKSMKETLLKFLVQAMGVPKDECGAVLLEDLYTPIDRCIADGLSLRGWDPARLACVRSALDYLISAAIGRSFRRSRDDRAYVDQFATFLVALAAKRADLARGATTADAARKYDPFSIISLNWDILLDNAIDDALKKRDASLGSSDYDPFGVVDYCCYVSPFEKHEKRIRSGLWSLGCRGYNVKLLKLHGSMNWLQCTNCQQLFTSFGEKLVLSEKIGTGCRHCKAHNVSSKLRGTLIMPTFLKDLSNFQLKLVWQNAGVELMEAHRLVFIGYSFPHADFEFRQLLTRMVHPPIAVEVVLLEKENSYPDEKQRYKQFFAGHDLVFHGAGVEAFVDATFSRNRNTKR